MILCIIVKSNNKQNSNDNMIQSKFLLIIFFVFVFNFNINIVYGKNNDDEWINKNDEEYAFEYMYDYSYVTNTEIDSYNYAYTYDDEEEEEEEKKIQQEEKNIDIDTDIDINININIIDNEEDNNVIMLNDEKKRDLFLDELMRNFHCVSNVIDDVKLFDEIYRKDKSLIESGKLDDNNNVKLDGQMNINGEINNINNNNENDNDNDDEQKQKNQQNTRISFRERQLIAKEERILKEKRLQEERDYRTYLGASCEKLTCTSCHIIFKEIINYGLINLCEIRDFKIKYHYPVHQICEQILSLPSIKKLSLSKLLSENKKERFNYFTIDDKINEFCLEKSYCDENTSTFPTKEEKKIRFKIEDTCKLCTNYISDIESEMMLRTYMTENVASKLVQEVCNDASYAKSCQKHFIKSTNSKKIMNDITWYSFMNQEAILKKSEAKQKFPIQLCQDLQFCKKK